MSGRSRRTVLALIAVCCLGQPFTRAIKAQVTLATAADLTAIGGSQPLGGLVRGADGALYGTTAGGGAESCGIIYRLTTDGILSLVHSFTRSHGCYPVGELTLGPDGSLYGVTYYGGDTHITFFPGLGTVFKVLPNGTGLGTFTLLRSFPGAPGGTNPYGTLTLAPNGLLYGTATGGSIAGGGLIFTIDPQLPEPDNFAIVANGLNSQAALTLGLDGFLYGTTWIGNFSAGTVFRMPLNGAPETLYSFPFVPNANPQICPEGAQPLGELIEAADGHFYGSTSTCGPDPDDSGTIFRVTPAGDLTTLHVFSEGASPGVYPGGAAPWGGMTLGADGNLYGATTAGGDSFNGILYRVTPGETPSFEILRSFSGTDGTGPQEGRLLEVSPGVFYGTSGGGPGGSGQVFKLSVDVNSAPVAQNGTLATVEDVAFNGTLTASDIDDDPLAFTIVTNGTLGSAVVTDAATGAFTYTPNANVSGTDTFTFKGNDGTVDSNVATVTVTITPINDAPVANDASITTTENTPISGTLSANDAEGQALTFSILSNGTRGTPVITDSSTGAFTYTPNANVSGADSFTFQASDGFVTSNVATVSVTITAVNLAPVARSRMMATTAGTTATGTLAGVDAEGDALTFSVTAPASQGTATVTDATTGAFTYTPGPGFFGFDSFTFQVSDGTSSATASQMVLVGAGAPQWPGQTVRASVHNTGAQATTGSACPSASADGRFVAFNSLAALVDGDTNGAGDVFLHDRLTSTTTRVSVGTGGTQGNGNSQCGLVSANGRFVVFESAASNLVAGDTNGGFDLFRHDRETGQTVRVNVASGGVQVSALTQTGGIASVSADGRRIAFSAFVGNLVPGDTNGAFDVFVHDADTLETVRISVANDGTQGSANSLWPAMSGDGRYVAFESAATNLVAGDTNGAADIFVRDLELRQTFRVSLTASGGQAGGSSQTPKMPLVGGIVMFQSFATNLVPGVTASGQLYARDFTAGTTSAISLPNGGGTPNSSARFTLLGSPVSADGRFVTFLSLASNLVAGDTNGAVDVFIRDRVGGTTARVSVSGGGAQALDTSFDASMSADGRFAVLSAAAANLVTGDTNAASDVFAVGGVSVTPANASAPAAGATGVVDVTFAYPGTVWAAASNVPWLTISSQSSTNSSGTVGYTIAPNTSGTARTGTLTVATQTVTVTQGASTAPVAQDGMLAATEDTAATGTLVAVDPNGDTLTYAIVTSGTLGTVVVTNATTGAFTYTPSLNMNGTDSFTFQASDGTTTSNIATVHVTVAPVNDAPVAANGALTTAEDTAASGTLAAADADGPGQTFTIVANGARGSAAITNAATGAFTYTPNADANGTDTFTFQVSDGALTSNVATTTVTITAVDDAPTARAGVVTTTEQTAVTGQLQAADPDGGGATFSVVTQPAQGSVVITDAATGAFTYTPNATATGYDPFTFQVTGAATTTSATESVFVVANSPRWAGQTVRANQGVSGNESNGRTTAQAISADGRYVAFASSSSNLVAGDTNGNEDVFVFDRVSGTTTRESVSSSGAQASFGGDSPAISADGRFVAFTSFASSLVLNDTNSATDVFVRDRVAGQTVRVSVGAGGVQADSSSSLPAISADGRYIAFLSSATNLVAGDTNNLGDVFVHDRVTGATTRVSVASDGSQATQPTSEVPVTEPAISADGRYVAFTSNATNLVAGDTNDTLDIFVRDVIAHVTERVSVSSDGTQGDQFSFSQAISADGRYVVFHSSATGLVAGDTNATLDVFLRDRVLGQTTRMSVSAAGAQANGASVDPTISADGRYVAFLSSATNLAPGDSSTQRDVFVRDRSTGEVRLVSLTVGGTSIDFENVQVTPHVSGDGRFVAFSSVSAQLVAGDTNGQPDDFVVGGVSVTPTVVSFSNTGGTGTIDVDFVYPGTAWSAGSPTPWISTMGQSSTNGDGTFNYRVAPNPGAARVGALTVATQTVTITQEGATAPVALDGTLSTSEDTPASGTLLAGDPNGDALTYTLVVNGSLGTAVITNASTGAFTYTPNGHANGTDTFTFLASDGTNPSNLGTVTVTIAPVNDAPVAANSSLATNEDTPASGVLSASDVDGPSLSYALVGNGARGVVTLTNSATGAFTYTPNSNTNGSDTFTFQASDASLTSNVATVTVTITAVNDAPVARTGVVSTSEGTQASGTLAATDIDSDTLTFSVAAQPSQGVVTLTDTSTGAFTYTPHASAIGYDRFTFVAHDDAGGSSTGTQMVFIVAGSPRWPGQTVLASVSSAGVQGEGYTRSLSADGRFVVFGSSASWLVSGDTNDAGDIFVLDRVTSETTRVSVSSDGAEGNDASSFARVTPDGRFVVFQSDASTLVAGDSNNITDIFVRDLLTQETTRVSLASDGSQANGRSVNGGISADGRWVVFSSTATTLVSGDTNATSDVFVHDRSTGLTTRVSIASDGAQANPATPTPGVSQDPQISADGRFVTFVSPASNLVPGDTNGKEDIFVHDGVTRQTTRVSVSSAGQESNGFSSYETISADGRWVAFMSASTNLAPGDTNGFFDIFLHDRLSGQTTRASVSTDGNQGNADSFAPTISADGRYISFFSAASTLVPLDSNGVPDAFVHDRVTARTVRLSVAGDGTQADGPTVLPTISADGRFVAFSSAASNLVLPDLNPDRDVFVVGGVSVTPTDQTVASTGGVASVSTTFAYPGTPWTAVSNDAWITVTNQSSANGNGTVSYTVAPNTGPARMGTLTVALQTVTIVQAEGSVPLASTVTTPNGGEKVFANVPTTLHWTSEGGATSFDVELSRNSGATFTPIPACTALPGSATSCTWTPTGPNTSTARIRVTARNGTTTATDTSDADFAISTATPSITVTTPNTALSWVIGATQNIRWNHNLGALGRVRVELSRNSGGTWETLAASFQNTGATSSTFPWVVTGPVSSTALVRVTWLDGTTNDVSNVAFSIVRPTITATAPNTGVTWTVGTPRTITWTHNMASGQLVNLDVSRDGGVTWSSIATSVANATATTGTFDWVVTGPATSTARVRVSWASDTAANDASNVNFSIVTPSIAVTAPNTAVTWRAGNTQTLRFTHNLGAGQPVAFDVSRDGGSTWTPIISLTTTTSNAVTYAWVVSGPPTPLARIRARWTSDPGVFDVSDVNFAIISRITVTAPNTAVTWGAGSTRQVTWAHNLGLAETVNIDVSPDGGATWVNVAAGVANATATSGSFAALMPGSVTTQALVRVSQTTDPTSFDTSDVQFTLAAPVITVTAPNTNVNWPIGSTRSISWSHNLGTGEAVEVALSRDNGATWAPLTSALANTGNTTGTFSWVVTGPATTTGRVRVTWMRNGAVQDVSNVAFRIQ